MESTATARHLRREIDEVLADLPEDSLAEVMSYVKYVRSRSEDEPKIRRIVKLEGLWADAPFDVTHEEVRELRRHISARIAEKAKEI
ncbi:MAG: hypothetical protein GXP42_09910 [Chloroflexi bacterium]|nr:hypothetical protein [Chloroflexota bacterium]